MNVIINECVFDGNHETTKSIMQFMSQTDFKGKEVIDIGCGSGILTVYASERGAKHITAVDFDSRAVDNTRQNLERNGITNADVYWTDFMEADLHADIILANLPREAIAMCMPKIRASLNDGGTAIISRYKEVFEDELLQGWTIKQHFVGETYDSYILTKGETHEHLLESNTVGAEPVRSMQVMGYRISSAPPSAPINLNIYICGQKTI